MVILKSTKPESLVGNMVYFKIDCGSDTVTGPTRTPASQSACKEDWKPITKYNAIRYCASLKTANKFNKRNEKMFHKLITKHTLFHYKTNNETLTLTVTETLQNNIRL